MSIYHHVDDHLHESKNRVMYLSVFRFRGHLCQNCLLAVICSPYFVIPRQLISSRYTGSLQNSEKLVLFYFNDIPIHYRSQNQISRTHRRHFLYFWSLTVTESCHFTSIKTCFLLKSSNNLLCYCLLSLHHLSQVLPAVSKSNSRDALSCLKFFNGPLCHSEGFSGGSECLLAMQETWARFLGREDPLEKEIATHSSTLAWKIPWMRKPGRLPSIGSQRVGQDWATSLSLCPHNTVHTIERTWLLPTIPTSNLMFPLLFKF